MSDNEPGDPIVVPPWTDDAAHDRATDAALAAVGHLRPGLGRTQAATPRIETADTDLPDHNWPTLKARGHLFPADCPRWTTGGLVEGFDPHLPEGTIHVLMVCACGVMQFVPLTPGSRSGLIL